VVSWLHRIHRDIKSDNILIGKQAEIKLADFGYAVQLSDEDEKRTTMCGSPFWMAPEVIQETNYDGKAYVWSLGVTAIEMAEIVPPNSDVHPMRVLFMIPRDAPPRLQDKKAWSANFHSFVKECLVKDPSRRPTAQKLLQHKFVIECKSQSILAEAVAQCKELKANRHFEDDDDDDEGTYSEDMVSAAFSTHDDKSQFGTTVDKFDNDDTTVSTKQASTKKAIRGRRRVEADPSRGFGLQDKLQGIYRKDCTIRVPFLNLNYLSPLCLLDSDSDYSDSKTISELCNNHNYTKNAKLSPTLGNLVKTLAYHRKRQDAVPMTVKECNQADRVVVELTQTLKTIFRV